VTESEIVAVLRDFGLTEKEAEVYLFLAKTGVQRAGEVSKRLKMHKAQVYRILEVLQSRGLAEATLDFPARFVPVSFEHFLDMTIRAKREEAYRLEARKTNLLTRWGSIIPDRPSPEQAKFTVIKGRENVYSRILELVEQANSEVLAMTDSIDIIRSEQAGIFDLTEKHDIRFRILTNVKKDNYRFVKGVLQKTLPKQFEIEGRHKDLGAKPYPRFVIRDSDEIVFFLTPTEETSIPNREETVLWTNSREIVSALRIFFEGTWDEATDLGIRINEIETGASTPETVIIRDAEEAHQRFCQAVTEAREELIVVSTSKGFTTMLSSLLSQMPEKPVTLRILVSLDFENLEVAEALSKHYRVKYTDAVYSSIAIVDGTQMFMFKAPLPIKKKTEPSTYFDHLLYTNDADYLRSMRNMLDDLWNKSLDLSELKVEAAMRSPPVTITADSLASKAVDSMLANNIGSVIVVKGEKPVGIITEKDVLNRLVGMQRDPEKTTAEEIMSSPLITISSESSLLEALNIMKSSEIRRLVVVEKERLVGVLSERRVLEKSEAGLIQEIGQLRKIKKSGTDCQFTQ
jgi:sugar-specific transcriptional regulator TrmB/CBS domain-containing protein